MDNIQLAISITPEIVVSALLVCVVLAVSALTLLRLPAIPAYFIAGLAAGPNGLGLLHSSDAVHFAAEIGIILLLFTIGLKFNIKALKSLRHTVFVLGGAQVAATALLVGGIAWFWLPNALTAALVGFVAALSSTAIVSQILIQENIVTSPVGRRAMGVLLFQDLAVIPLIIVYSGGDEKTGLGALILLLATKILLTVAFAVFIGPRLARAWLNWAARAGDKDLFVLHVVAIIILSSVVTHALGLSFALGAFLAGILISETFHRHRVEQFVEPFRQLFLGFFFMTLGALVNPQTAVENAGAVLALTVALLALKTPLLYACLRLCRSLPVTAFKTALLLGGSGEFGFVLLTVAQQSGILADDWFQLLVPANLLALVVTPFLWKNADALAQKMFSDDWLTTAKSIAKNARAAEAQKDHVIIVGFGRTGQAVAGILGIARIPFVVIENDHIILQAVGNTRRVIYGGGERVDSLLVAGIGRAKALVVTHGEQNATAITTQTARKLNKQLHIVCKARTPAQADALLRLGASEALVDAHETGLSLAREGAKHEQDAQRRRLMRVAFLRARKRKDLFFKGVFAGMSAEASEEEEGAEAEMTSHTAPPALAGKTLREVAQGIEVVFWQRGREELDPRNLSGVIVAGDEFVFMGNEEAMEKVAELFVDEEEEEKEE